ncbi:MAG: methionine--tRNA ligase [Lachnospiraceae bacterium]|nr:methionine--tRNA ligase [Lachnospiraceae bacterium]
MKHILIGGAWPYANGSLHIGHLAALLPGDVLARYWRANGNPVFYVSGSDCHGTPITIRARQENRTPDEISETYHNEFCRVFQKLGFSYDLYTKTSDSYHKEFVQNFHSELYKGEFVEERTVKQAFCPSCRKVLTDRLIIGICPSCGEPTRGDQCDSCGTVLDTETILDARCADCHTTLTFGETTQLYLLISRLEQELRNFLSDHPYWRKNAASFTRRYLDEGLHDRAITRDLDWGIDVPKEGYDSKKIYIWAENVLGYLSASARLCEEREIPFREVFGENARHYYVHGKDNIPFHTIILPSLLLGHGQNLHLPDDIISSEYITLEGRKISTSHNWAVWAKDLADEYHPDTIRYFFLANGPEKRDTDFSWREFKEQNNSELVGAWGNFVNRTLAFLNRYQNGAVPSAPIDPALYEKTELAFQTIGTRIEHGYFKDALSSAFDLVRYGNKYYDSNEPWKTRTSDPNRCCEALANCTWLIGNLAILLHPFLPFSSGQILEWLKLDTSWNIQTPAATHLPPEISILFSRI